MTHKLASELRRGDSVTVHDGNSEALGTVQRIHAITTQDICDPDVARFVRPMPMLEFYIRCANGRRIPGIDRPINYITVCVDPGQRVYVTEMRRSANYAR